MKTVKNLLIIIISTLLQTCLSGYPVAFFHGIGNYCNANKDFIKRLSIDLDTHVECVEVGNGFITSIFQDLKKQAKAACESIKKNPHFQSKFSVFGVSQGTLIGRYIIEVCQMEGQVMRYLSFDGPQMGIGSIPKIDCPIICEKINSFTKKFFYTKFFQKNLAPANYYKYRHDHELYFKIDTFLKDLNNEDSVKNESYKRRFSSLEKVLLIKGKLDTVITPRESSWFEFYDLETGAKIIPLNQSHFYIDDYIGVRYLNEQGKLQFVEFEGEHIFFNDHEYNTYIVPFFKN